MVKLYLVSEVVIYIRIYIQIKISRSKTGKEIIKNQILRIPHPTLPIFFPCFIRTPYLMVMTHGYDSAVAISGFTTLVGRFVNARIS